MERNRSAQQTSDDLLKLKRIAKALHAPQAFDFSDLN
jgi:hypothetical protein